MREMGFDITAAHFDHALQAGSDKVAVSVGTLCARLGVELVTERRASPMPRGSVQAGARDLRYEFLERARARVAADLVALAHTADDVVEGAVLFLPGQEVRERLRFVREFPAQGAVQRNGVGQRRHVAKGAIGHALVVGIDARPK